MRAPCAPPAQIWGALADRHHRRSMSLEGVALILDRLELQKPEPIPETASTG